MPLVLNSVHSRHFLATSYRYSTPPLYRPVGATNARIAIEVEDDRHRGYCKAPTAIVLIAIILMD